MRQGAISAWSPVRDHRIYAVWIAAVWAAIITGFGLDLTRYLGEAPPPSLLLHVHAVFYVLWLALVTLQILWVETGNLRRHKQLGWWTVAVSALMVPLGLAAALVDQVRQVTHADYAPQFLALEFEEMIAFSVFMAGGIIYRRSPAAHKRLMILSAVSISDAGFARIWVHGVSPGIPNPLGFWLQFFSGIFLMLVAMAVWDLWQRRRIHPAVLFGAALLLTGEVTATLLNFSPTWHEWMVRLVNAWGYAG